jgi:serine/threonine-protein kinase
LQDIKMPELPSAHGFLCPRCRALLPTAAPCPRDGTRVLHDRTGQMLMQRYRFQRPLGRGGMGVIWEAEQVSLHRKVAIKLLPANDEEATTRFRRGAVVMAKMAHPNIVALHDFGEHQGPQGRELFLVMERLSGAPLTRYALPFERSVSAAAQTLTALEHVHRRGYIHRDVKPANLFVTAVDADPFVVKLLDFGIARHADGGTSPGTVIQVQRERSARFTQPLKILGTPEYMAPEQILGLPLDLRVDLYAVGVMLFLLVAGRLPFPGDNRNELYTGHLRGPVPSLASFLSGPREALQAWQEFFERALAKAPAARFDSAPKMREVLLGLPDFAEESW